MHIFERDQRFVIEQFRQGCFDYLDGVSEVMETELHRRARGILCPGDEALASGGSGA